MNQCGKYNTNWCCPPGVGDFDSLKDKYNKYQQALVFTLITKLEDAYDIEGMDEGRVKIKTLLKQIQKSFINYNDYSILGAGSCDLCLNCSYPSNPCRFPLLAYPSIEAVGINVASLSKVCHIPYNNGINTVTYFAMILLNKVD
jgi:predicted metal-binding protein